MIQQNQGEKAMDKPVSPHNRDPAQQQPLANDEINLSRISVKKYADDNDFLEKTDQNILIDNQPDKNKNLEQPGAKLMGAANPQPQHISSDNQIVQSRILNQSQVQLQDEEVNEKFDKMFPNFAAQTENLHKLASPQQLYVSMLENQKQPQTFQKQFLVSYNANLFHYMNDPYLNNYSMNLSQFKYYSTETPFALLFMILFKIMVIFSYTILPFMVTTTELIFHSIFIHCMLDFWTVKNVCGRILLGMKWWIEIDSLGKERWVFECKTNYSPVKFNERVFWFAQGFFSLLSVMLMIISMINLDQGMVICFAAASVESTVNILAYTQCLKIKSNYMNSVLNQLGANAQFTKSVKLPLNKDQKL